MNVARSVLVTAVVLGAGLALAGAPAPLDGPHRPMDDPLLDRLAGSWRLSGTIQGAPAEQTLEASWVLNHQFLRLDYQGVGEPPAGEPRYQATVHVGRDNLSERYVVHWLDVFGGRWSETLGFGSIEGTSVTFRFEYPDGPFENTFTWDEGTGRWRFLLRSRGGDGTWSTFADLAAVPAEPAAAAAPPAAGAVDLAALEEQVRATEAAFAATMADRDHAAFASFVAEDAVFVGRSVLRGRAAVAEGWKRFFEGPEPPFAWAPERVAVAASGTLALSSGPVLEAGQRVGTFNSTWRREPDGSWKIVLDNGCPACPGE
jgi:ketosteroid isomerase-like protein